MDISSREAMSGSPLVMYWERGERPPGPMSRRAGARGPSSGAEKYGSVSSRTGGKTCAELDSGSSRGTSSMPDSALGGSKRLASGSKPLGRRGMMRSELKEVARTLETPGPHGSVILASMNDCATSTLQRSIQAVRLDGGTPVLLVRHARTADNAARVLVGRRDVPLDEVGRHQAARLRAALTPLAPSTLVTSPLARARQTLAGLGPAHVEAELVEVDHGEIEGLQEKVFLSRYQEFLVRWRRDPEHTCIPGGESLGQAARRSYQALEEIARQATPSSLVVVCSHQLVIATLLCRCQQIPLARYHDFTCRNTGINLLGYREGTWSVPLTDLLDHLEG